MKAEMKRLRDRITVRERWPEKRIRELSERLGLLPSAERERIWTDFFARLSPERHAVLQAQLARELLTDTEET